MNFELQRGNLRARPLLLAAEEGVEGHVGDLADLESDAGNVTDSVTLTSESTDKDLVVLLNEVQTAVIGDESSDLLSVLDELNSDALSNGGVWLFGFDTDFVEDDSFRVGRTSEGIGLQGSSEVGLNK